MSNFVEINSDPDEIRAHGAMLAGKGHAFTARTQDLVGQIRAVEAGAPWGSDHVGRKFLDTGEGGGYYYPVEGADKPFNDYVQTSSTDFGPKLTKTGEAIDSAMTGYQFADLDNQSDIAGVQD